MAFGSMSVYLTLKELEKIGNGSDFYKAKIDYYSPKHIVIAINSSFSIGWVAFLELKKRNGDDFKVTHFYDTFVIVDNIYGLRHSGSLHGKPKTKNEFYKRLAKFKENMLKIEKEIKHLIVLDKKKSILKDFM